MTLQDYYNLIEGGFWKEKPNEMMANDNVYLWVFHQPTRALNGLFVVDYRERGRTKRDTGTYAIEIKDDAILIRLNNDYHQVYVDDDGQKMIWKSGDKERIFNRKEKLEGSDNIYQNAVQRIE